MSTLTHLYYLAVCCSLVLVSTDCYPYYPPRAMLRVVCHHRWCLTIEHIISSQPTHDLKKVSPSASDIGTIGTHHRHCLYLWTYQTSRKPFHCIRALCLASPPVCDATNAVVHPSWTRSGSPRLGGRRAKKRELGGSSSSTSLLEYLQQEFSEAPCASEQSQNDPNIYKYISKID